MQPEMGSLGLFRGDIAFMDESFDNYDYLNKHDFYFVMHVAKNFSL